jgi:DtxR family Mn-dependent transcriptional regulator
VRGEVLKKAETVVQKTINLSASLEDYLEAILNLSSENNVARSKDIAVLLEVSRSSVTGALKVLGEKGLVNYKPYGFITLTDTGRKQAEKVARKHEIIRSFFIDVLGVDAGTASKAACEAEHAFGSQIVKRLLSFIEFVTQNNKNGYDLADEFSQYCRNHSVTKNDQLMPEAKPDDNIEMSLSETISGQKVRLAAIDAGEDLRSRLAALGMVPNVIITVISKGNPGPFIVSIKGSRIALGRKMADMVTVKPVRDKNNNE